MADSSPDQTDREFVVSHQGEVTVEQAGDRKQVRFAVLPFMQGHTFTLELRPTASNDEPTGPYRFEYVLGTEFAIHENDVPAPNFEAGYSHLRLHPDFGKADILLTYADTKAADNVREAKLVFTEPGGVLKRIVIESTETKLPLALRHLNQFVADILDAVSFVKRVPLAVRHLEVHSLTAKYEQRYLTLPYRPRAFTPADVRDAQAMPARLRPALRLFREAISSNRPPYRLLCLYRIREVLEEVGHKNTEQVLAKGDKPVRPKRTLSDNDVTREFFADYVGKKVGMFLDHVRTTYRLPIAHANVNEYFKLILDPADVRVDHRLDYTNAVLEPVVAEMISDEFQFMTDHGLAERPPLFEEIREGVPEKGVSASEV